MKKVLLIFLSLMVLASGLAAMTGTRYSIPALSISGGGEERLSSDRHQAQDVKGQGVIGAGSSTLGRLGLGGIYTLGTGEVDILPPVDPPPPPLAEVDEGAVILNIVRAADSPGSALTITWEINLTRFPRLVADALVDIYVLTGDGRGQYVTDGVGWEQCVSGSVAILPFSGSGYTANAGTRTMTVPDQVGRDPAEIYFKGMLTGFLPTDVAHGLATNAAVGKVNIALGGETARDGKNIISTPLWPEASVVVADVFGQGSGSIWQEGDLIQYKTSGSPSYLTAIYVGSSNEWRNAADTGLAPAFEIDFRQGYEIITNDNKIFSAVGKVHNADLGFSIYSGTGMPTGGKTLFGLFYPVSVRLVDIGLIAAGAREGDMVQIKVDPLSPSYISAVMGGGTWQNAIDTSDPLPDTIARLRLPNGYTFVRYGAGFTWTRTRPW